jgi:putative transposase
VTADAPNRVWALDFQFDVTTDGRPIKIVSIIDEHTRSLSAAWSNAASAAST